MENTPLVGQVCVACRGGIPPLARDEVAPLMAQVPAWKLADDGLSISRGFTFKNFKQAEEFVVKVGAIAEEQGHHPDIEFGWGYARFKLWTHAIKGLHQNDFIVAARIDALHG